MMMNECDWPRFLALRYGERVCIFPCGEFFSEMYQIFQVYVGDAESFFIFLERGLPFPLCVNHGGMS